MKSVRFLMALSLMAIGFAGCVDSEGADVNDEASSDDSFLYSFEQHTLPAVYREPLGLYEPTIDVGGDGNIYVSAHSTGVGENPAPAYVSHDDGATWESMALFRDMQMEPHEQGAAPFFSDEVFIVAGEDGEAWGMDCCTLLGTTPDPVTDPVSEQDPTGFTVDVGLGVAGLVAPNNHLPVVGWCADGREVCYYNQHAIDHTAYATSSSTDCVPYYGTDRPWLAYNNGKLLMVNNPGLSFVSGGQPLGGISLQLGAMDTPPATPIALGAAAWGIDWNLCASSPGGHIPGIPDMRADHFFAAPQRIAASGCGAEQSWELIMGNAADVHDVHQTTAITAAHVSPAETDSTPSQVGWYGQASFDANGDLYVGVMNNTAGRDADDRCIALDGGMKFAYSNDDGESFTHTTFRFDRPVSSMYMDGNRYGEGFLLNWGEIDGPHTDWYVGHVFPNENGTLRLENVMLAVDDGPESSRHVQGAAMGPDGRAYLVLSYHAQNPGGQRAQEGDTPMFVAVQEFGPRMPVS